MKQMKKYQKYLLAVVGAASIFGLGTLTNADNVSWQDQVVNNAQVKINDTTNTETNALLGNIDNTIADKLSSDLSETVQQKQDFLKSFMENYFAGKIDGLKDSPEYASIQKQIDSLTEAQLNEAKKQIDDAVANAMK